MFYFIENLLSRGGNFSPLLNPLSGTHEAYTYHYIEFLEDFY